MKFNRAVKLLLLTNSLVLLAGAMLAPIYALFVTEIGGSLFHAGLAGGVFATSAAITTFAAGLAADRVRQSELIVVIGYGLMAIGFLIYTTVDTLAGLMAVQALIGAAEAIYSPAFNALFSKHITERKAGRMWGAWELANYSSIAIGAVLGGTIATVFGFQVVFVIMAILSIISALYIYRLPRRVL